MTGGKVVNCWVVASIINGLFRWLVHPQKLASSGTNHGPTKCGLQVFSSGRRGNKVGQCKRMMRDSVICQLPAQSLPNCDQVNGFPQSWIVTLRSMARSHGLLGILQVWPLRQMGRRNQEIRARFLFDVATKSEGSPVLTADFVKKLQEYIDTDRFYCRYGRVAILGGPRYFISLAQPLLTYSWSWH